MILAIHVPPPEQYRSGPAWRAAIANEVQRAVTFGEVDWPMHIGAVSVSASFLMPEPKAKKKGGHIAKPDLGRALIPALESALQGIAVQRGCQVVEYRVRKEYGPREAVGAYIEVRS